MHVQTHLMASWCVANLGRLDPRGRFLCVAAGVLPDLDGLGILISQEAYWDYHHVLCHNLFFGVAMSALLAGFSSDKAKVFFWCLAVFHMHLLMDLLGSGEGWQISYLWPFSKWALEFSHAWGLYSWQNFAAGVFFLALTLFVAVRKGRTFIEYPTPQLDRRIVEVLRSYCPRRGVNIREMLGKYFG